EEPLAEQVLDAGGRLVLVGDAAPEQVPDVRRQGVDLPLLAVERKRVVTAVLEPERLVEAALQVVRLALELRAEPRIAPHAVREPCAASARVVDVALDLARRARQGRERAVAPHDRVPRVFPALVLEATLGVATLVLDVAVAVAVAEVVDPRERRAS